MKKRTLRTVVVLVALAATGATAQLLPPDVVSQLPDGYEALLVRVADFNADRAKDFLVVAGKRGEEKAIEAGKAVPKRWLLAFIRRGNDRYDLVGKNPEVAFAADQGGQCDPLLDAGRLVAKGRYFTVENVVACGEHWTDTMTFKYDDARRGFVFHRRTIETWKLNPARQEDVEALVSSGRTVTSANRDEPVSLDDYRPQ